MAAPAGIERVNRRRPGAKTWTGSPRCSSTSWSPRAGDQRPVRTGPAAL